MPCFLMRLRDAMIGKLTDDEMAHFKAAFDVIGDIAILEIDDILTPKEHIIAETLLGLHKNIKTVLRKAGEHSGRFRTQKMRWLAGKKTKETIHTETGARLMLDVEKVYFSPRLSTERKRITEQVKSGENILVMFSGCAPYPCVIGKNTKARRITGIEINPVGHVYAMKNIKLNKLRTVSLFNGDVKEVVPGIIKRPTIGLKANWRKEHLAAKLKKRPKLLEIYIGNGELEDNLAEIKEAIEMLKSKGITVMLHTPLVYKGIEVNMCSGKNDIEKNTKECYSKLEKLCTEHDILGFVAHVYSYSREEIKKLFQQEYRNTLKSLRGFLDKNSFSHMYIENMPWKPFSDASSVERIVKRFKLRLCLDLAHLYNASPDEDYFFSSISRLSGYGTYFHIADCSYLGAQEQLNEEHSCPVGKGHIDFERVIPYIRQGIIEVKSKDEKRPKEMLESFDRIEKIIGSLQHFDRIIMPLPKSAEEFLPTALAAAGKGTIIHFYDFLHENDFSKAEDKAKAACRDAGLGYKKLGLVRCGQHSPRTYRVCLDFKVS